MADSGLDTVLCLWSIDWDVVVLNSMLPPVAVSAKVS